MPQNVESRGAARRTRLSGNVCSAADTPGNTAPTAFLQASRISQRFAFSPALAAEVAALAYAVPETWSGRS